ncbi:hypothetical protein [Chitinibacter sp. GC72]|uniref:hypothetical protein n=1 Tax=Chitinibacter sp. GC72 TaxID=1526917 RepID=UPI0012F87537|nr:hypothetical protein [Chitinibacter sp. GC72]
MSRAKPRPMFAPHMSFVQVQLNKSAWLVGKVKPSEKKQQAKKVCALLLMNLKAMNDA